MTTFLLTEWSKAGLPRERRRIPSLRIPRAFGFLLAACVSASLGARAQAAEPPTSSPAEARPFWDRWLDARSLRETRPDSALRLAESVIARDPDDFIARWLRGACLAKQDSIAAETLAAEANAGRDRPGLHVQAASALLARGRVAEGRAAYVRARDAYRARGRLADASRATLWKAMDTWDRGERPAALEQLAAVDSLARASGDSLAMADVLVYRGVQESSRDMDQSVRLLREAVHILNSRGASKQLPLAHRELAASLRSAGKLDEAETHYRAAMDLGYAAGDSVFAIRCLDAIGTLQRARGAYPEALAIHTRALELVRSVSRDPRVLVNFHYNLGLVHGEMGHRSESRDEMAEALGKIDEAKWDTDNRVNILDALGAVEGSLGNYDAARARLEEALAGCVRRNLKGSMSFALLHLSELHGTLAEDDEALRVADRGIENARATGQRRIESGLLTQKARVLHRLGRYEEALEVAREAKRLSGQVEPRILWWVVMEEAEALHRLRRTPEAIAAIESTVVRFGAMPDSNQLGAARMLEGSFQLDLGNRPQALVLLGQGLDLARAVGNPSRIADAELSLGPALLEAGRPLEAIAMLEHGLRWFERVRSAVKASGERSAYQSRWNDAYVSLAVAYARAGRPDDAFATMERGRARELRRLFARKPGTLRTGLPAALGRELERTELQLTRLQANLLAQYALPPARRPATLAALERRVDSLQAVWSGLDRRAQREAATYAREMGLVPAIRAREVKQSLRPGERLIAFMVGQRASLAFDFGPGRLAVRELPWSEQSLAARVDQLVERLRADAPDAALAEAAGFADTLLGRSRPDERAAHILYIVPDGALHYLPFEALRTEAAPGGARRYLAEASEVVYAPSATLLFGTRPVTWRAPSRAPLVAFGDPALGGAGAGPAAAVRGDLPRIGPLPFARREVDGIRTVFPATRVFVGDQATESRFFAEASGATVLHVAAHAFVDESRPEFSGIVLAPTPGEAGKATTDDGLVQAFEVAQHRCDVELATLSACETGRGRLLRGEGLIGLARAFRLAGVKNLVVSLWKVDDAATAEFMAEFYRRLGAGATPAAALRGTKVAFLSATPGRPPSNARSLASLDGALPDSLASDEAPAADSTGTSSSRGVGRHRRSELMREPPVWAAFVLHGSR